MAGAAGTAQQQSLVDLWYQWAYGVLNGIGAPTSQTNLRTLWNWSIKESGSTPIVNGQIVNNPLNTTQHEPGSVSRNSAGVQAFPDISTGVLGTTQTLLNGRYPDIVQALRNSTPAPQWASNPRIVSQLNTWGSHSNWLSWNNAPPQPSSQFQSTTESPSTFTNSAPGGDPISQAINAALGPIGSAIQGAEQSFVEKAGYLLLMITGGLLMVGGIAILVYAGLGRAVPAVGKTVAGFSPGVQVERAKNAAEQPEPAKQPAPKFTGRTQSRLREYGASDDLETRQEGKPTGKLRPSVRAQIRRGE